MISHTADYQSASAMALIPPSSCGRAFDVRLSQAMPDDDPIEDLPGFPGFALSRTHDIYDWVEQETCSSDLDRMSDKLWLMSFQSSANVSPLHRQRVKGRRIVITEEPKLHLTWMNDRIFIKPIPAYLLSLNFWNTYLDPTFLPCGQRPRTPQENLRLERLRKWSIGYLRTYAHLIRYESDFRIAHEEHLLPKSVSWAAIRRLNEELLRFADSSVCLRYHYGELRLTRLNFYAKFLLGKSAFQRIYPQYNEYFARFYAPLLFAIAMVSVMLSAMQLEVNTEQLATPDGFGVGIWVFCKWFSIVVFVATSFTCALLCLVLLTKLYKEWRTALYDRYHRQKDKCAKTDGNVADCLERGIGGVVV